jgi:transposase
MDHIGIDVHKRESQICILADGGELIERRIRTEPERFAAVLGGRPRARIVIEASTDSEWVARCLETLGHEVIVADPNFAPMYATRTRKVKTDRRDARALADACVLGAYRRAHRLSDVQRHVRGRLLVRDALVRARTRYISVIRALLRQQGYRVPSGGAEAFTTRGPPGPAALADRPAPCRHARPQPGCGVRSAARNIVTDGLRAVPIIARVGHGESSQSELDTQMFPWLSAAFPTG